MGGYRELDASDGRREDWFVPPLSLLENSLSTSFKVWRKPTEPSLEPLHFPFMIATILGSSLSFPGPYSSYNASVVSVSDPQLVCRPRAAKIFACGGVSGALRVYLLDLP
jgi:hypothetical protein